MNPIKSVKKLQRLIPSVMVGIALAGSCVAAQAASDIIFGPTGTEASTANGDGTWTTYWGGAAVSVTFDAANPPATGDVQGSVYVQNDWLGGAQDSFNQLSPGGWFGAVSFNGGDYATIVFDFKYDTTSTITPSANAHIEVGLDTWYASHDVQTLTSTSIDPATSTPYFDGLWHHVQITLDPAMPNVATAYGVSWYEWNPNGTLGTMNYWVANVKLVARVVPVAPPTVKLIPAVKGLAQFADATPSWDRQSIITTTNGSANLTWYGRSKPVSYSWTVASWPGVNAKGSGGMIVALTLTPDLQTSQTYGDADWSSTNCLWIPISGNPDGTVTASIAYKTGQPVGNGQLFGPPTQLATGLTVPTAVGTWTLTFTSDTDMTLTAPNGSTTSVVSLPSDVAALFNGYVGAFLYTSPQSDDNIGEYVTLSAYNITGVATPVHEDLTSGALSAPFLRLLSQGWGYNYTTQSNQLFVTSADAYWFSWTLPYVGFSPVVSTNLAGNTWNGLATPVASLINGKQEWNLLSTASATSQSQFYGMIKRTATQLQILLPGMTATPNVSPGYSGTPTAQLADDAGDYPFNVIVNSVDSNWFVANGANDTIALSCPDLNFLVASTPEDLNLNGGTVTFSVVFLADGSSQITATDVNTPVVNIPNPTVTSPTVTY